MASKAKAKTISDFRQAHDADVIVPNKIRETLAAIEKEGAENWVYEGDFLKLSGLSTTQLARYRDKFEAHIVTASNAAGRPGKRCYFGNAKVAAKLRG